MFNKLSKLLVITSFLFAFNISAGEADHCKHFMSTVEQMVKTVDNLSKSEWHYLQIGQIKEARKIGRQKALAMQSKNQFKDMVRTTCSNYISSI
jgi:ribosomal protein RSM22 (predicted rRNA methylase)